jgi:hypothetical protein
VFCDKKIARAATIGCGLSPTARRPVLQKSLKLIGIDILLAVPPSAAGDDACSVSSSVSDVQFTLALGADHAVFQAGEVVPLSLAFSSAQVAASLRARNDTGCYRTLLRGLADQLPHAEASTIEALNDSHPEVTRDAIEALRRWGTSAAEAPLWRRLERLHQEWADRVDEMHSSAGFSAWSDAGQGQLSDI